MTPPRVDIDKPMRLRIVRHLMADALTLHQVADEVGLSYEQVLDVANRHGYPDERRMTKAIEMLQDGLENDPPRPTPPRRTEQKEDAMPVRVPEQDDDQLDLSIVNNLVGEAQRSSNKRTATLGDRLYRLVTEVTERVVTERAEVRNAARIAELQAEIDRLRGAEKKVTCKVADCGHPVANLQGLNLHRTRAHGLPNVKSVDDQEVAS